MVDPEIVAEGSRLTARGVATRARILQAAADLMFTRGVGVTTLDDVRAASGTSKSQLYRYFPDKEALVREVIELQAEQLLEQQGQQLQRLNSIRGLERWRDAIVQRNISRGGAYGCPLGSLASEVADQNHDQRTALADHFRTWESLLSSGLARMRASGLLRPEADPERLATGLMAALQGGYLLAQTQRDSTPMQIALDMAIDHVKAHLTQPEAAGK